MDFLLITIIDNEFDTIDDEFSGLLVWSKITEDISQNITKHAITDLHPPETPSTHFRFKQSTEEINKQGQQRKTPNGDVEHFKVNLYKKELWTNNIDTHYIICQRQGLNLFISLILKGKCATIHHVDF